jgi:steroid 5-alpha reductase family enzyme
MERFLTTLAISFAINLVFFAIASMRKTDVFTDLSYSLSFALTAVALPIFFLPRDPAELVPSVLVVVWAARLGSYLFGRIRRIKVDHRFDGMREKPLVFARFWILQALTVAIVMLPVSLAAGSSEVAGLGPLRLAGVLLWLAGFLIESVADSQKYAFKTMDPKGFVSRGLWKYSRHPNYFGESLAWWGLFVYAVPSLSGFGYLAALGPAFITLLLLFVSGIPLLEKSADAKHGADPAYIAYKKSTSVFIPLPPRGSGSRRPK